MAGLIGDNPILLDNASGTEKSFTKLKGDTTQSVWIDTDDSSLGTTVELIYKQGQNTQKSGIQTQRTLVSLKKRLKNSSGQYVTCGINFTLYTDIDAALSFTDVKNLAGHAIDLLSDGGWSGSGYAGTTNIDKLLLGVLP